MLIPDIFINIVLAHVVSFPTNLVSLNSESVCKSCGCFGKGCSGTTATRADVIFYYRSRAVLPRLLSGSTAPDQNLVFCSAEVGTEVFFLVPLASSSTATICGSTVRSSGSTVRSSGTTAPKVLLAFLPPRCCVSKGYYRPSGSTAPWSGSTALCGL